MDEAGQQIARSFAAINDLLVIGARDIEGREASPTVGIIDSQSLKRQKAAECRATMPGKRSKVQSDALLRIRLGFMLIVLIHAADIQDREGASMVLKSLRYRFPSFTVPISLMSQFIGALEETLQIASRMQDG